ncbi:hypothetical protein [Microcoleus sp. Pol17_C1]
MHASPAPIAPACLTNYFAFPFGQGRAVGFVRDDTQSASVMLSWMRWAIGMEDDVSQN